MIGTVLRAHSVDYTYGPLLGSNDSAHLFAEIPRRRSGPLGLLKRGLVLQRSPCLDAEAFNSSSSPVRPSDEAFAWQSWRIPTTAFALWPSPIWFLLQSFTACLRSEPVVEDLGFSRSGQMPFMVCLQQILVTALCCIRNYVCMICSQ